MIHGRLNNVCGDEDSLTSGCPAAPAGLPILMFQISTPIHCRYLEIFVLLLKTNKKKYFQSLVKIIDLFLFSFRSAGKHIRFYLRDDGIAITMWVESTVD